MTIKSLGDRWTDVVFHTGRDPGYPPGVAAKGRQRMGRLDVTSRLHFLANPAGMRLRRARGFPPGYMEVHVRERWWLVFQWKHPDAHDVRLVERKPRAHK
jgi:plasmid maintenance system killer protein